MLALLGVSGVAGLAGCFGEDGEDGEDGGDGTDTEEDGDGNDTEEDGDGFGDDEGGIEDSEELPEVGGTYNAVTHANYTTLNPMYNTENNAGDAIGYALDQGYTFDANQEYFPLLYDMSTDNGEVWVFELRENLEFSDPYGQVTAEDFVYQIQELHQSEWANTAFVEDWAGVNVEQNGEFEFQAELESPEILWPESYSPLLYPVPRDLMEPYVQEEDAEGLQQDEELLELQFTGNLGPYVMDEWERGSGTSYSRNENYYLQEAEDAPDIFGNAPYFEGASIDIVEEESSRVGALQAGEADSAGIPPERFEELSGEEGISTYQIPQPYNRIISVNMRDNGWNAGPGNLFRHVPFRQALASAINKEEIIEGIYNGLAEPHYTWQPRFSQFYPGDDAVPTYGSGDQYGSEVARELAQEAFDQSDHDYGFDGDAMITPEGDQVVIDLYYSPTSDTNELMAEYIGQELGNNLGIEVETEAIEGTRFDQEYWVGDPEGGSETIDGEEVTWENPGPTNPGPRSATSNEPWDMSIVYGLNTYPRNPLTNQVFFDGPDTLYNPVGYYPEFDAQSLFEDARSAESQEEVQEIFQEIFVNLAEEQPYIMLVFGDDLIGYNADLQGPIENFSNGWDFAAWHFDE